MRTRRIATVCSCVAVVATSVLVAASDAAARSSYVSSRTLLGQIPVAAEHTSGYSRALFPLWTDADSDGCDTRVIRTAGGATTVCSAARPVLMDPTDRGTRATN